MLGGAVEVSAAQTVVCVDAAVAQEGPPAAHVLCALGVDVYDGLATLRLGRHEQQLPLRPGDEARAPEVDA